MKFSASLSTLLVLVPLALEATAVPFGQFGNNGGVQSFGRQRFGNPFQRNPFGGFGGGNFNNGRNRNQGNNNKNNNGNNNNNNNNNQAAQNGANGAANVAAQSSAAAAAASSSAAAASSSAAAASAAGTTAAAAGTTAAAADTTTAAAAAATTAAAAAADSGDVQESLTLDPSQVQPNLAEDGQAVAEAGQVPSLTSKNNFINFCLTQPNLPLTNGQQVITGSCNPTIMGVIIAKDKMPSGKFVNPPNFSQIAENTTIAFKLAVANMETGNFVNAQTNYFAAPQQINGQGLLVAHSHITVNKISSFQDTQAQDPQVFAFFKGLNAPAVGGILEADAAGGLPAGFYRACSINTAANHQPALVGVAQHASLDDCIYFEVTANPGNGGISAAAAATSTAAAAATTTAAAAATTNAAAKATGAAGGVNIKANKNNNNSKSKPFFQPPNKNKAAPKFGKSRGRF